MKTDRLSNSLAKSPLGFVAVDDVEKLFLKFHVGSAHKLLSQSRDQNPKIEIRISKQIQSTKSKKTQTIEVLDI